MKKVYTIPQFLIKTLSYDNVLMASAIGEFSTDFNGNGSGNWFDDDGGFGL